MNTHVNKSQESCSVREGSQKKTACWVASFTKILEKVNYFKVTENRSVATEEVQEGLEAEITRILRTLFGVMDVFLVFIEVMVSRVYTYLKAYEIRHVK